MQIAAIAIDLTDPTHEPQSFTFEPNHAIRAEEVGNDGKVSFRVLSKPPDVLPAVEVGKWLERDAFGQWSTRDNNHGSDAKFVYSRSTAYLVSAKRGDSAARLSPVQVWAE